MPMSERQRRQYNRDCASVAQAEKDWLFTGGALKRGAEERLRAAWVSFDQAWNDRTPSGAQMAGWLQSLSR